MHGPSSKSFLGKMKCFNSVQDGIGPNKMCEVDGH